jgi:hypothetical protein
MEISLLKLGVKNLWLIILKRFLKIKLNHKEKNIKSLEGTINFVKKITNANYKKII